MTKDLTLRYSITGVVLFGVLLCLLPPKLHAGPAQLPAEQAPVTALDWLKNKRNYWGKLVGDTGHRLDAFFANTSAINHSNDSYVKIALKGEQKSGERSYLRPQFKFRLDLPALKERLKLVIESETEETQSLEETNRERTLDKNQRTEGAVGALQIQSKPSHRWNASTSVGIDFQIPLDPFWRSKANYVWTINDLWRFELRESLYHFHSSGWGETTQLEFERSGENHVFRTKTEAKYKHASRSMEFAQIFSVLKELSDIRALTSRVGILGQNKPQRQTTAYFVNTTYRRKIYSTWLFYELTPEILFPRNDNFNLQPSLTAKIELVFSSDE